MSIQHMQMVFDAGDLTSAEKSVLLAYCNFTDPHGYCWPGVERIADMTGISERTVKRTRSALAERGLLGSKRRITKTGQTITSMTRVNLDKLAGLKRATRDYADNVIEEITFTAPEEATGHDVTPTPTAGATVSPGGCHSGPREGDKVARNPSVDPSCDPSSSSAEVVDITSVAVTTATTKRKNESPEEIVIERTGCTPEEAVAVVDLIETQGDDGKPIRRIVPWVRGRTDRDLQRDLAQVRRHSAAPTVTECGIHACEMKPYGCDACAGEAKGGDAEDRDRLRAHLAAVGEKTRPDLARLLGAPQRPAGASFDRDPAAYYRGINKAHRSAHARPQDVTGALAPVVTAEQIRNGTDDFRL